MKKMNIYIRENKYLLIIHPKFRKWVSVGHE